MSTLRSAEKPRVLVSVGAVRRSTGSQGNNSFTTCRDQNSLDLLIRREKESLGEERKKKKKTGHQNTRKQGGEVSQKKRWHLNLMGQRTAWRKPKTQVRLWVTWLPHEARQVVDPSVANVGQSRLLFVLKRLMLDLPVRHVKICIREI